MKRFISISVVLMIAVILIGCSGMTAEQRKDTYDLRKNVGDSQFVGATSPDSRAMNVQMRGY
jgi:ABC-type uncharacterized transport system auxiliary subunit